MKKLITLALTLAALCVCLLTSALAYESIAVDNGVNISVTSHVYQTTTINLKGNGTQTLYTIPDGSRISCDGADGLVVTQYNLSGSTYYATSYTADWAGEDTAGMKDGDWRASYHYIYVVRPYLTDASGNKTYCGFYCFNACDRVAADSPFYDVNNASSYYFIPVCWGYENEVVRGKASDYYGAGDYCTRAQIVTFLWRSQGSPAPKSSSCPFTDLDSGEYYYNAVLWAYQNGIVKGTDSTHFSPAATCTRGQMVTFIFRMYQDHDEFSTTIGGTAEASNWQNKSCPFKDVSSGAYYYDPVRWAYYGKVTNGKSSTSFDPEGTCTRAEAITFIYRGVMQLS